MGAERAVNCEHMQALVMNTFQRTLGVARRLPYRPFYRYNAGFMASLGVTTAFDVARPAVVSRILTLTGVHGHVTAALLAEMQDLRVSVIRKQRDGGSGIRDVSARVGVRGSDVVGDAWPNTYCGKQKKNGRPEGVSCHLAGKHDNEYVMRGMMWADNYWLFFVLR